MHLSSVASRRQVHGSPDQWSHFASTGTGAAVGSPQARGHRALARSALRLPGSPPWTTSEAICARVNGVSSLRSDRGRVRRPHARIALCRADVLHRVRHGAYIFADDVGSARRSVDAIWSDVRAVLRTARGQGCVLSHISAVAALGLPLWELPLDEVHVTRLGSVTPAAARPALRQHRGILLAGGCHYVSMAVRSRQPTRTALDLTTLTDVEHALPVSCARCCGGRS